MQGKIFWVLLFVTITIGALSAQKQTGIVGGRTDVANINSEAVQRVTSIGANHIAKNVRHCPVKSLRRTGIQKQVVSGLMYFVEFHCKPSSAGINKVDHKCTVQVWDQSWLKRSFPSKANCQSIGRKQ